MSYTSFEYHYQHSTIKHLVLFKHNDILYSPPFCTELCKDYSRVLKIDKDITFIDVDTPPATSKYNSMVSLNDSIFFAPYGIYDNFNTILELNNDVPHYYNIDSRGKGQFYNMATDNVTAFASPLGYEPISFGLFISEKNVKQIYIPESIELKRHMGTVYCNGYYYSPPRGESYDYNKILRFNPLTEQIDFITVNDLPKARRKYTDFIVHNNKLFALPLGRDIELKHMLVYDTLTETTELVELNVPDYVKKYNCGVVNQNNIIALPYGHKQDGDSNYGLCFDTTTYQHKIFDIGYDFGGKYRFRSGCNYNDKTVFLPAGSVNAPVIVLDVMGNILFNKVYDEYIIGRPIIHNDIVHSLAYHLSSKTHYLFTMDNEYKIEFTFLF